MCDNTTAENVINHMGTCHSDSCDSVTKKTDLGMVCIDHKMEV